MSQYQLIVLLGQTGPFCRDYYQSDKYSKCDEKCQKSDGDYEFCCKQFNYCNFYSTTWFFWLMFFLVVLLIAASIFACIWQVRKNRKRGSGDDLEEEPSDTI